MPAPEHNTQHNAQLRSEALDRADNAMAETRLTSKLYSLGGLFVSIIAAILGHRMTGDMGTLMSICVTIASAIAAGGPLLALGTIVQAQGGALAILKQIESNTHTTDDSNAA